MRREQALELGEQVLRTLDAGQNQWPLSLVREVFVFGSVARGALTPHDLDLDVEHGKDPRWARHVLDCLVEGRDMHTVMRVALRGRRRSCQLYFNGRAHLDFAMTLLWRRGDDVEQAVSRLRTIPADPSAERAPREAMLAQFEGLERRMPRDVRHQLHDAVTAGRLAIERLTLPDGDVADRDARWRIEREWAEASPLRRAALAVASHWEHAGVDLRGMRLHSVRRRLDAATRDHVAAGFDFRYAREIPHALGHGATEWIEVAHPTRTRPLDCLRIIPAHTSAT